MVYTTLVFALAAVSASPVNQPITVKVSKKAVASGAQRHSNSVKAAMNRFAATTGQEPLSNSQNEFYSAAITVGNGQQFTVDLDTGSSDVWLRGGNCQSSDNSCNGNKVDVTDSSLTDSGQTWSTSYGSGSVSGEIYTGPISLAGATASNLPFGASTSETGFSGVADGLLGLGFDSISQISSTLGQSANFFDALGYSGNQNRFSFYLSDAADKDDGEVTLGGVDTTKFTGTINYVPLNAQTYWQFDSSKLKFTAGSQSGTIGGSSISDTGTTLVVLGTSQANAINKGIGAGAYDSTNGVYPIDCGIATTGKPITLTFPKFSLSIPAKYYVLSNGDGTCVSGITQGAGNGVPNIFGDILTRAYYTIYDKANNQVGFALAKHP
ncbi:hypothetical protein HDV04_004769 [Boothiomyces sp. JEL0838]|nr:hypothetical protein HDV04_004769 [Boothiomyces sp. JEL0838]